MKEYKFHSSLPTEEIISRLRERTRPWSRWDAGSAVNTFFLKEQKNGLLRLVFKGMRSYVFADLELVRIEKGTEITATMSEKIVYNRYHSGRYFKQTPELVSFIKDTVRSEAE